MYHGIDHKGEKGLNSRFISISQFESQIRFLKDHCDLVSLADYFDRSAQDNRYKVSITFDDGYQNNLLYALPILEKYGVPATFFLTSASNRGADWLWMDFLDVATRLGPPSININETLFKKKKWIHTLYYEDASGRKLVDWARYSSWSFILAMEKAFLEAGAWSASEVYAMYWKLLTPPEIRQLGSSPLVEIGAHGHTHQDLSVLHFETACEELRNCKLFLDKICGKTITALAYPFGSYTRELVNYAEEIGFTQQLVLELLFPHDETDPRLRSRFTMNPFISEINQWVAVKNGKY